MDTNLSKLQETAKDRGAWHAAVRAVTEADTTLQLNSIRDRGTAFEINAVPQKVEMAAVPASVRAHHPRVIAEHLDRC